MSHNTLIIFERAYCDIPPLVPKKIIRDIQDALAALKSDNVSQEEAETVIYPFALSVWPYKRAFDEVYRNYTDQMAHRVWIERVSRSMRPACDEYFKSGGTFDDMHTGRAMHLFESPDDRRTITELAVELAREFKKHVRQAVLTTHADYYKRRIAEFKEIIRETKQKMEALEEWARADLDDSDIALEVNEFVRGVRHSVLFLGPRLDYGAVMRAGEHFEGRKEEKRMNPR